MIFITRRDYECRLHELVFVFLTVLEALVNPESGNSLSDGGETVNEG